MVVCYDDINSQRPGTGHAFTRVGPAVNRDQQGAAVFLNTAFECVFRQSVSLIHAVGDEALHPGAQRSEQADQQRRGRYAVDIIVAKDRDGLLPVNGRPEALRRLFDIGQEKRIREVAEPGI